MSESSLSTRWWNQTRLQRATEKTYLSQLAAAQVQPNLKMRTAAGNAGARRKPSATALTAPARDAIDVLRAGTKERPLARTKELRDMRSKR
jgi:hypothetical protein